MVSKENRDILNIVWKVKSEVDDLLYILKTQREDKNNNIKPLINYVEKLRYILVEDYKDLTDIGIGLLDTKVIKEEVLDRLKLSLEDSTKVLLITRRLIKEYKSKENKYNTDNKEVLEAYNLIEDMYYSYKEDLEKYIVKNVKTK